MNQQRMFTYGLIFSVVIMCADVNGYGRGKKTKCFAIPTFPTKVEAVIKSCQDEVKTNLIEDLLFAALNENPFDHSKHQHVLKDFEDHLFHHHDASEHHQIPSHQPVTHIGAPHHHHHLDPTAHYLTDPHHQHSNPTIQHIAGSHLPAAPHLPDQHHHLAGPTTHHFADPHHRHLDTTIHHAPDHHNHHASIIPNHHTEVLFKQADASRLLSPIVAHETSLPALSKNKPSDPHDNHHHISTILEKLRSEKPGDTSNLKWHRRSKRSLFGKWKTKQEEDDEYHPTVITHEDRWLAGCLMQCVFRKNNAVDKHGYPTLDGLTDLYTAGTTEQAFFIHVLRAVDKCLKGASTKHQIYRGKTPVKGETCDVAFDVFDCVSDSITEYCN